MGTEASFKGGVERGRLAAAVRFLKIWLAPLLVFLVVAATTGSVLKGFRQTVWSYFTDDNSIREEALDGRARLGVWEEPCVAPGELLPLTGIQGIAFAPDGGSVIVGRPGAGTNLDLFSSTWDGRKWSQPVPLAGVNSASNEKDPAYSPDGKVLFFSSDRPGGNGGYDLWIARWDGAKWAGITNAGPAVNTGADEMAPTVCPDGKRLYYSSNRTGSESGKRTSDFDVYVADLHAGGAEGVTEPPPAPTRGVTIDKKNRPHVAKAAAVKSGRVRTRKLAWSTNAVDSLTMGVPAPVPEIGAGIRESVLNSKADDLYVTFSPAGDFAFLSSNRKGGLGGFDLYRSHILDGKFLPLVNMGITLNSEGNDACPVMRMNGFDILFTSDRSGEQTRIFGSTMREVTARRDLSRVDSLISNVLDVKWWIVAFFAALAALVYLAGHYRNLTDLFHKCLLVSAILHMVLLMGFAFWKISEKMAIPEEKRQNTTVEFTVNVDNLANEKLALDMAETTVTKLPASEVTVVAKQAAEFLPTADFVPQEKAVQTVVARSDTQPVQLENTPSKPSEIQSDKVTPTESEALRSPVANLPELTVPGDQVVMETREPAPGAESKPEEAFAPVMNVPTIEAEHSDRQWSLPVTNHAPVEADAGMVSVPVVTNLVGSAKSLAGSVPVVTRKVGGKSVRRTGVEAAVSTGAAELKGPGEEVSLRLAAAGDEGDLFRLSAPGALDVPDGFSLKIDRYALRKGAKQADIVIEGLGGSGTTETAVERALDWFKANQDPDGRWSISKYGGQAGHDSAATAMAMLCYMGWGCKHTEPGKYQASLKAGLDWLVKRMKADGDLRGEGNMYDQGIATLAVTEAYALTKDKSFYDSITNAVGFIVRAQNKKTGGWRYKPGESGDTSVLGWQLMALKSAKSAGIPVPQESFELANRWLTSVGSGEQGGLCGYDKPIPTPTMSAEAMFCRQLLDMESEQPIMRETVAYLNNSLPNKCPPSFYYWYYGSLALHHHQGPVWEEWNRQMKEILIKSQIVKDADAGSWNPKGTHGPAMGRVVATAMATLTLEVYYRYLPITGGHR